MPKSLHQSFASTDKADALKSRNEALARLFVETLQTLKTKNIISHDDIETIFDRAMTEASVKEFYYLEQLYSVFVPSDEQPDGDEEA